MGEKRWLGSLVAVPAARGGDDCCVLGEASGGGEQGRHMAPADVELGLHPRAPRSGAPCQPKALGALGLTAQIRMG